MRVLKLSTARDVMVWMADVADHVTGLAGLTLTITASKAGGAFAAITPTVTDRGNGWYSLALTASHTDTAGDLALYVTAAGADSSQVVCQVVAYDPADADGLGLANLDMPVSGVPEGVWVDTLEYLTVGGTAQDFVKDSASQASVTVVQNSVDGLPEQVWTWSAGARSLTTFGTLVADAAAAVWAYLTASATTVGSLGALVVAKLGLITSSTAINVADVVDSVTGTLRLIRGDTYDVADGASRAITISRGDASWPAAADVASIAVTFRDKQDRPVLTTTATMAVDGDSVTLAAMTAAQSILLVAGQPSGSYDVVATLDSGSLWTLARGSYVTYQRQTR